MSDTKRIGKPISEAKKVAIMIHGRGASAESIVSLKDYLNLDDFAILAPQAPNNTWYPYSFMAPDQSNEPSLTQAIEIIDALVKEAKENGFTSDQIYFIGFSQGACLSLEYAARNASNYGGVIAFTGGLIGEVLDTEKYSGKVLLIYGLLKTIDADDKGYATVVLGNSATPSSIRCSIDTLFQIEKNNLQLNAPVTVKGICTGFNADELGLGADVLLNRCIIIQKETTSH